MLKVIKGDLFDSKEKYIVHQTNCCTTGAAGLAYDIFKRYPYSDVYSCRLKSGLGWSPDEGGHGIQPDAPGTIIVRGNGEDQRYVVALMGQYYGGPPGYPKQMDGAIIRQRYFHRGLWQIAQVKDLESVAFPKLIGCGIAAGDWNVYFQIIKNFARYLDGKADVFIYDRD